MEAIPEEIKDAFVDSDPLALQKVKKLKEILHEQFPVSLKKTQERHSLFQLQTYVIVLLNTFKRLVSLSESLVLSIFCLLSMPDGKKTKIIYFSLIQYYLSYLMVSPLHTKTLPHTGSKQRSVW